MAGGRLPLAVLSLVLLVLPATVPAAQNSGVSLGDEELGYLAWRDLKSFTVYDNGTHLILVWEYWAPLPTHGEPWCPRDALVYLDLDNNRYTGRSAGWLGDPAAGAEMEIHIFPWMDALFIYYGRWMESHPEWLTGDDTSYTLAIPLSWLNLTDGQTIAVLYPWTYVASWDHVWVGVANYTVPYANVTIDGDQADWAGIPVFAVDPNDDTTLEEGFANATGAYAASNGTHLFLAVSLGAPLKRSLLDLYDWWDLRYSVAIDVDNDNRNDYLLEVYTDKFLYPDGRVNMGNLSDGRWYYYPLLAGANFSGLDTGFMEIAVEPSILGLPSYPAGTNITITLGDTALYTHDYTPSGSKILYTIGTGGYTASPTSYAQYGLGAGTSQASIGSLNLTLNLTGGINLYLWEYSAEPTGNATLPRSYRAAGNYYVLLIDNPGNVQWPITLRISVPGARSATLFYYNKTSGTYMEVAEQAFNPQTSTLLANLSMEEYLAGDEPVVVAATPLQTVGGVLDIPVEHATPAAVPVLAAIALVSAAALVMAAGRRR